MVNKHVKKLAKIREKENDKKKKTDEKQMQRKLQKE